MINFEYVSIIMKLIAEIAQLVEHFTRNEGVMGSSPTIGSNTMIGVNVHE